MDTRESKAVGQLQSRAGTLWAGLTALAALTRKAANEAALPPGSRPQRECRWGDDTFAAAEVADQLVKDAETLASDLDPIAIQKDARGAK